LEVKHGRMRRGNEQEIGSNVIIETERNGKERKLNPAKDGETTPLSPTLHPQDRRRRSDLYDNIVTTL